MAKPDDPNDSKYGPLPPRPPESLWDDIKWFFDVVFFGMLWRLTYPIWLMGMGIGWIYDQISSSNDPQECQQNIAGELSVEKPRSPTEEIAIRKIQFENQQNDQNERDVTIFENIFAVLHSLRSCGCLLLLGFVGLFLAAGSAIAYFR